MLPFGTNNMAGFSADELAVLNDAYQQLLADRLDEDDGPTDWTRAEVARVTRDHVLTLWSPGITAAAIVAGARGTARTVHRKTGR